MVITKKHLSRRTALRGLGATIALPLLDGMVPAFAAVRNSAARPVKRLGAIYVPNGMSMPNWRPAAEGSLELTPILTPLAPVKDRLVVVSGTANEEAKQRLNEGDGDHSRCQAAFLTGAHAVKASGTNTTLEVGVSMDQLAARELREDTQLASLELSLEANELVGQCEDGYGCAYSATLAWRDANTPARRVRAPVRRGRQHGPRGAAARAQAGPQHPRFGGRRARRPGAPAGPRRPVQAGRLPGFGARHRAAHPDRRVAERPGAAGGGAAGRHSGRIRGIRRSDVRSDAGGLSGRPDPRLHVPVRPREERADLSGDRRQRAAPPGVAPPPAPGAAGEAGPHQHLPHGNLRAVPGEDAVDARRRRLAARPGGDHLRRRHGQQQRPRPA
ncbi:MAG: DUF1552 domain-containing protein [Acidobacteria bacterium]|nr:DUF1552 domain-containing protein [Acidobacteriota bacterium]